jgi:hypothetical protein
MAVVAAVADSAFMKLLMVLLLPLPLMMVMTARQ